MDGSKRRGSEPAASMTAGIAQMTTNNALAGGTTSQLTQAPGIHFRVLDSWRGVAALLVALFI